MIRAWRVAVIVLASLGLIAGFAVAGTSLGRPATKGAAMAKKRTHARLHATKKRSAAAGPVTHRAQLSPRDTYAYWTRERMRNAKPAPMETSGAPSPAGPPAQAGSSGPGSAPASP